MFKDTASHDPGRLEVGPSDLVWDHLSRNPQIFLNPLGQQKWPLLLRAASPCLDIMQSPHLRQMPHKMIPALFKIGP